MTQLPKISPAAINTNTNLENFFNLVRIRNPFLANRVDRPLSDSLIDVFGIHETEYRQILNLGRQAHQDNRGLGVVVWGEAGVGKTHLLARLGRWAAERQQACFVYLHNLQGSPERVSKVFLQSVLGALTNGRMSPHHKTPLFQLINSALREALVAKGLLRGSWGQVREAFYHLMQEISAQDHSRGVLFDKTIYEVLFRYYQGAYPAQQSKGHHIADLALRWLYGEALSLAELDQLEIPLEEDPGESGVLVHNQRIKKLFVAFTQIARMARQLFLVCFDQVDNLDENQIKPFSRFLHDLLDSAGNFLLVTTGVRQTLLNFLQTGVITETSWDRIGQVQITLDRITRSKARDLLLARLQRFFEGFRGVPEIEELIRQDNLFPLGTAWLEERLQHLTDLRPRDLLTWASGRWQQHQEILTTTPGSLWLARWKSQSPKNEGPGSSKLTGTSSAQAREQAIDARVNQAFEARLATLRENPSQYPPNEENLLARITRVLQEFLGSGLFPSFLSVEKVESQNGTQPTYDLVVRHRFHSNGQEMRYGLKVLVTNNGQVTAHVLRRLLEETDPPNRVFLITDQRQQLPLGPEGKRRLDTLKQKGASQFKLIELSFAENAQLEAMLSSLQLANKGPQNGDNSSAEQNGGKNATGQTDSLSKKDILASHVRQNRPKTHRLLHMVLESTNSVANGHPPGKHPLSPEPHGADSHIQAFILSQVHLSETLSLEDLAYRFLEQNFNGHTKNLNLSNWVEKFKAVTVQLEKDGLIPAKVLGD